MVQKKGNESAETVYQVETNESFMRLGKNRSLPVRADERLSFCVHSHHPLAGARHKFSRPATEVMRTVEGKPPSSGPPATFSRRREKGSIRVRESHLHRTMHPGIGNHRRSDAGPALDIRDKSLQLFWLGFG